MQLPVEHFSTPTKKPLCVCLCVCVVDGEQGATAHRLIPAEVVSKLLLSHPQGKSLNARLCLTWGCWAGAWIRAFMQVQFHTTPILTHCQPERKGPALPRLSTVSIFQWVPCAGTTGLYTHRSAQWVTWAPGQQLVLVTLPWLVWWETQVGSTCPEDSQNLTSRGRGHWCQVVLPLPPAALPSPSCWCQCSWNYAVGQMRNLIQLKANMTLKQKNV